jgi:hypothetical protein
MSNLTFEDFIPTYPEDDDPDIQKVILHKREFLMVAGQIKEEKPRPGDYYTHQKALLRYMKHHDNMLVIHETGTGKTCSLVAIAEYFKKNESEVNRIYILEKGKATVDEFKKQIACTCTDGTGYLTKEVQSSAISETNRKSRLTRNINRQKYKIMTYGEFAKEIETENLSPEGLEEKYSGCIFFVDEAHNLSQDRVTAKRINKAATGDDDDDDEDASKYYDVLWKLFHSVKRSKIICATATPMLNDIKELPRLMNLLLPMDQQMPTKWDYDLVTLEQLEPFFRGKVSYVRGLDTGAVVEYQGEPLRNLSKPMVFANENQNLPFLAVKKVFEGNNIKTVEEPIQPEPKTSIQILPSQSIVYRVPMSKFQSESYKKLRYVDETESLKKKSDNFKIYERNAACLVFPDGSAGGDFSKEEKKTGAGKYVLKDLDKGKVKADSFKLVPEFKRKLENNLAYLQEISSKYTFIIRNELNPENFGNAFIYSEIKTGSGAIVLGKIMEVNGFEKFNEVSSVFVSKEKTKVNFCAGDNATKEINKTFEKKLRYGILSSQQSSMNQVILELFNSYENRNGEYCKVLIGTQSSRDGINVYNVRRGYLTMPTWNPSSMHQALSRFIRSTSHIDLIREEEEKLKAKGMDPSLAKVDVKIYKLAATLENGSEDTVDFELYTLSEEKDIKIRRMMRFLKQCAFDCPIHYNRNVREGDIDYSPVCDYKECKYSCYCGDSFYNGEEVNPEDIDDTTYDILYTDEVVEACRVEIVKKMRHSSSINIRQLYKDLSKNFKKLYIDRAINNLIVHRYQILDRFGFPCYINSNGIVLYTQNSIPRNQEKDVSDLSYYRDSMVGVLQEKFDYLIEISGKEEFETILDSMAELPDPAGVDFEKFSKLVDLLTNKKKVELIEESIYNTMVKKTRNPFDIAIRMKFKQYIKIILEPLDDINLVKREIDEGPKKRGRVRKEENKPIFPNLVFKGPPRSILIKYQGGVKPEEIAIHTFSAQKQDTTSYNITSNLKSGNKDIRILKPSENTGWRDVNKYEYAPYEFIIEKVINDSFRLAKQYKTIGTVSLDGKFRIIKTEDMEKSTDPRSKPRGLVCTSARKIDILIYLKEFDFLPEEIKEISIASDASRESMIEYLVTKNTLKDIEAKDFSDEDLIFFTKWELSGKNMKYLCKELQALYETQKYRVIRLD